MEPTPTPVQSALQNADLQAGLADAQGAIIAAVLILVGFVFVRKAFGK
ncbi:hypothetical protein [Qipengyuania gaetbuli]|nr:hypothetical protein [Qipengyuania gaetbuli]